MMFLETEVGETYRTTVINNTEAPGDEVKRWTVQSRKFSDVTRSRTEIRTLPINLLR